MNVATVTASERYAAIPAALRWNCGRVRPVSVPALSPLRLADGRLRRVACGGGETEWECRRGELGCLGSSQRLCNAMGFLITVPCRNSWV